MGRASTCVRLYATANSLNSAYYLRGFHGNNSIATVQNKSVNPLATVISFRNVHTSAPVDGKAGTSGVIAKLKSSDSLTDSEILLLFESKLPSMSQTQLEAVFKEILTAKCGRIIAKENSAQVRQLQKDIISHMKIVIKYMLYNQILIERSII